MEPKQVNIAIKKIKEVEFSINEEVVLLPTEEINFGFELTTNINEDEKAVELMLTSRFDKKDNNELLLKIKTSNVFTVLELADLYDKKNKLYHIPDHALITMLSLSISHSRALLAKNTLGTKFSEIYIPIVNPTQVFNQLFGKEK